MIRPRQTARQGRRLAGGRCRLLCAILLGLGALLPGGCDQDNPPTQQEIELAGETFQLELALTDPQRREGMMGRTEMGENEGMLFVFEDEGMRRFWMKNCRIPLDVIYLDSEGRIVSIRTMSVPDPDTPDTKLRRYSSRWPAQFAIELRAGRAEELGLSEGDRVDLPVRRLKAHAR
jgi:uncharacterized membrane protein (UPF0127 family)